MTPEAKGSRGTPRSARRRFTVRIRSADSARILLSCVLVGFSLVLGLTPGWASEINGSDIKISVDIAPRTQCSGQCLPNGLPATGLDPVGALVAAGLCGGTGVLLLFVGRGQAATRRLPTGG
ncbi:hypothetical protein LN996_21540 [Arthrobacter sp. AK01]|uniref:hypothetical protein n=1 Tax=Arthrobacter sp. AK01 TaxID=2894084 RepID=UPI001E309777|nr:hypothetical protein [Arthrobacter sp. AK01]MCD4853412.1 hypothetical protein [Arthrobacter sp. AK01]